MRELLTSKLGQHAVLDAAEPRPPFWPEGWSYLGVGAADFARKVPSCSLREVVYSFRLVLVKNMLRFKDAFFSMSCQILQIFQNFVKLVLFGEHVLKSSKRS